MCTNLSDISIHQSHFTHTDNQQPRTDNLSQITRDVRSRAELRGRTPQLLTLVPSAPFSLSIPHLYIEFGHQSSLLNPPELEAQMLWQIPHTRAEQRR